MELVVLERSADARSNTEVQYGGDLWGTVRTDCSLGTDDGDPIETKRDRVERERILRTRGVPRE